MSKKLVMIGNGGYSETLSHYIETLTDWQIEAFADEYVTEEGQTHKGKPYVHIDRLSDRYSIEEYEVILGVGYHNMNGNRKRLYYKIKEMGYSLPNLIAPSAILRNTVMGDANVILEGVIFEPDTIIGSNLIVWDGALIGHNCLVGDHNHFAAKSLIAGNVTVGESCFLGNHSTVKDGVAIADYTLVGAGAYVSSNTKPYDVVVPARSVTLEGRKSTDFI